MFTYQIILHVTVYIRRETDVEFKLDKNDLLELI